MQCSKCGAKISDSDIFCEECGTPISLLTVTPALKADGTSTIQSQSGSQITVVVRQTSGFAVASLILGIFGVFPLPVLAIIFGAVAIGAVRKTPNLKGRGMAITGICLGILWIILMVAVIVSFVVNPIQF